MGINGTRVFLGGLVAGAIMYGVDVATNTYVLARDWAITLSERSIDLNISTDTMAVIKFIALDLAFGLIAVFTYAAMRPRFGPGPKAAFAAAMTLFLFMALSMLGLQMSGFFSMGMYLKSSAGEFVSILAGTMAGAWMYKEDDLYS